HPRAVLRLWRAAMFSFASVAMAHTTVVQDRVGDVASSAPAYLDIAHAKVTQQIGKRTLYFQMEMASAPAETPPTFTAFNWAIDTPGPLIFDYAVAVRWCN